MSSQSSASLDAAAASASASPIQQDDDDHKPTAASEASSTAGSAAAAAAAQHQTILFGILANIVSSVGIILVNKSIMKTYRFDFVMFLSALHFAVCYVACWLLSLTPSQQKQQQHQKTVPFRDMMLIAATQVAGIVLMNISLQLNSVGFYQLLKLLTIPIMVAVQTMFYGRSFSTQVKLSLCVILIGIGIATVTDVELNTAGTVIGLLAVVSTALGQIFINDKKNKYELSAMQFLYQTMLPMAVLCFGASILFEFLTFNGALVSPSAQLEIMLSRLSAGNCFTLVAVSCALALGANLSGIALIGGTSPVTFQVIGHGKTILIFVLGLVLFPAAQQAMSKLLWNIGGIAIAMVGVIVYSWVTMQKPQASSK